VPGAPHGQRTPPGASPGITKNYPAYRTPSQTPFFGRYHAERKKFGFMGGGYYISGKAGQDATRGVLLKIAKNIDFEYADILLYIQ
jgi:hypothetical protein